MPLTLATGWRRFFLWLEQSLPEPAAPSEHRLRGWSPDRLLGEPGARLRGDIVQL